jgi:hypothetical protein
MSEFMKEPEMQYPVEESSEIIYLCKNRKCHNKVNQRGDLCIKCSPPEVETCGGCNTTEGVWALGFCSKCWIDRNTQISDGYFCGFAECKDCKVYPYSCRTCQCDSCGNLYSVKEGDDNYDTCYDCNAKYLNLSQCACGQKTISQNLDVCTDCYYSDPRIRHNINDE